ncbi:MAG: hypothetical protein DRJ03_27285 [Chloroflexi bacterium]|nr:MAG: hypothetical protein B6I35_11705 [Anaerolineaceae bacterium 4572_32.2]RLC77187.1 MAG: hypothetical protein DRJ03_27285 [Chloroflexota bacterium]HEY72614.1 GAF domain-containing sensor histidine kinase [Thermoflexia bacterium]
MEIWPYMAGIGIIAGLGHLTLFVLILFRRDKMMGERLALLYLGLGLLWGTAVILIAPVFPPAVAELAGRLAPVLVTALVVTQLVLTCSFLEVSWLSTAAAAGGTWTVILLLATLYFLGATPPPIPLQQVAQGGWAVIAAILIGLLATTLVRSRLALHRNRALYWLLTTVPLIAGQAFSLLPGGLLRGTGTLFHLAGGIILVRGVTSYWLPNIKAKLRSLLRLFLLFVITAILLLGVVLGAERFSDQLPLSHTSLVVVLAVIAALIYLPLYQWLQRLVNRLLAGMGFDPAQILREYSQTIGAILNLDQLARTVLHTVAEVLGVQQGALLVAIDTGTEKLRLQPISGLGRVSQVPVELDPASPILARILEDDDPLFQYEVEQHPGLQKAAPWERDWLRDLEMEVYLPIRSQGDLIGLLALGPQGTGEPYDPRATEFLSTLAQQTGVALQNARLFESLLDRNARITELNKSLRAAYERLERLDQGKSDFLTIASHELRTPLTQMRGYLEVLIDMAQTETLPQEQTLSLAESIARPTRRLEHIIGAMIDASEIDAEGLTLHFAPATLESTMRTALKPWLSALKERSITLTVWGLEDIAPIHADTERLCQAFSNLVSNGIKFTPDGGRITIGAHPLDDEHFKVTIADTGVGISSIDQELIFEKFYRVGSVNLHSSGQSKFKGAGPGLGLPIVRGVVEGHGGCIWVESEGCDEAQCPGSTFHIVLPYEAHRDPCRWKRPGNG